MVTFEILVVLLLIVVNGLLAMSEMALVSSRSTRLQPMADRGSKGARQALALAGDPGRFLSTVQIGITLIGVLAGAFSGANLADKLAGVLVGYGIAPRTADNVAFFAVVAVITYLSLIVGELVPKQIALRAPERIASVVAGPMSLIARIATPLVALLDVSSATVLRLLGTHKDNSQRVTDEEIRALIAEAEAAGVVGPGERRLLRGVMRLADRGVRAIMTPRVDIEWVDLASGEDVILDVIRQTRYARLVACDGGQDNVVGFVRVREILQEHLGGRQTPIRAMVQTPVLLPDTLGALEALDRLHGGGDGFGLVVDEYGHYEGVVTPNDALRAIRGQAAEASDEGEEPIVRRADGSWLLSGALPVDNLEDLLGIPLPEDRDYHTVAGLVLYEMRRLPKVGDAVTYAGWRFEVVDMDGQRIDKILAIGPATAKS